MITAIITQKGKSIPTVISQQLGILSEEHTKILAEEHQKELVKNIEESRVRPKKATGKHLSDSIQVEKIIGDNPGYGVGNIETINKNTPWMWWINFGRALSGRTAPPVDIGSFTGTGIPKASASRSGLWQHKAGDPNNNGDPWTLVPNKDIQAHNFIERALGSMLGKVRQLIGGR